MYRSGPQKRWNICCVITCHWCVWGGAKDELIFSPTIQIIGSTRAIVPSAIGCYILQYKI